MPTIIGRVIVNAFYYPKPESSLQEIMQGYVKATVGNKSVTEYGKKWCPHPYYPVFFVPFTIDTDQYSLQRNSLLTARDVSPVYWNVTQVKWEMKHLEYPAREQPRLEAILEKIRANLPEIAEHAKPLKNRSLIQRRRFLGQFPQPLREGIEERIIYGTINEEKMEYLIFEQELSTYINGNIIPRNPTLTERSRMPVKLFHRH